MTFPNGGVSPLFTWSFGARPATRLQPGPVGEMGAPLTERRMLMYPQDLARMVYSERLALFDTPRARYLREWEKQAEIDRLKKRLTSVREALKVATAQ